MSQWENYVALRNQSEPKRKTLGSVRVYR
ncbi:MAG: DUF5037 domain-containing protein [Coprococcus phoceensis]